jgi:hypothetical protein
MRYLWLESIIYRGSLETSAIKGGRWRMISAVWIDLHADLVGHGCTSFVSLVIGPIGLYLVATIADFFWARQVAGISADQLPSILVGLGQIIQQVLHSQSPYNGNVNEKRSVIASCVIVTGAAVAQRNRRHNQGRRCVLLPCHRAVRQETSPLPGRCLNHSS